MLSGNSSPSTGRMGIWSVSSVSQLYMNQQKTNSGSRMATCVAQLHDYYTATYCEKCKNYRIA